MLKKILQNLSSVKLAIVLFIVLAVASILGTLIPQQRSAEQYAAHYGALAPLLVRLQITDLYHSVWYIGLLALFALNTVVCTLTRLPMKWRKAFRPRLLSDPGALRAMKVKDRWRESSPAVEAGQKLSDALRTRRYRVLRTVDEGRTHILALKRRAGHFGSDFVHLGLLVILLGGILSGVAGFRTDIPLAEGETSPVPGSSFAVRLDRFTTEYHPGGAVKDWKSDLTVLEGETSVLTKTVEVNHPLTYKGFSFYQMSYGFDWDRTRLEVLIKKTEDPSFVKTLSMRPGDRFSIDDPPGMEIGIRRFLPDFVLGDGNQPQTRSLQPNNPAALVEGWRDGAKIFEGWIFANYPDFARMHGAQETDLAFELKGIEAPQYSVLEAARDPGVPLIWIGCLLLMGGLALAFYWPPWEIRAVIEDAQGRSETAAGGIASKSRDRFEAEFSAVIKEARRSK